MKRARAAKKSAEKEVATLVVTMPRSLHRAIKTRAARKGLTMKTYVLGLLRSDGVS